VAAPKYPGFDTLALHAGQSPDATTGCILLNRIENRIDENIEERA
jgi:hypothetical protein